MTSEHNLLILGFAKFVINIIINNNSYLSGSKIAISGSNWSVSAKLTHMGWGIIILLHNIKGVLYTGWSLKLIIVLASLP
jgi:hypothetical protein